MIIITPLSCILSQQAITQNKNSQPVVVRDQARFPLVCLNLTYILNNVIVLFQVCFNVQPSRLKLNATFC